MLETQILCLMDRACSACTLTENGVNEDLEFRREREIFAAQFVKNA